MPTKMPQQIRFGQILAFFTPLGFSASLVTISHVIINSTLARSPHPEMLIASYALPMSLMSITERPALLLRQSCSVLVRDHRSFRAMSLLTLYVLGSIFLMDSFIAYTPLGKFVFAHLFGTSAGMLTPMLQVYRILMFVTIFSGIRCLFHGIIISNMRTKWLTVGMLIRLAGMYGLSLFFIQTDRVTSGSVGALIFLTGMIIEAIISFWEGRNLLKKVIPDQLPDHPIQRPGHIFKFYKPLLFSSFLAVIIAPSINTAMGKTSGVQLSVSSFAIASSLLELVLSFFSYIHQIVLNYNQKDASAVKRFILALSFIPSLLIAILAYTSVGPFFMKHVMGLNERLMLESLSVLRVFMVLTLIFPWLDYFNGILMLRNQTKVFLWSQATNVSIVLLTLALSLSFFPGWNGKIGALAQSLGIVAESSVVLFVLRKLSAEEENLMRLTQAQHKRSGVRL